jgi:hypothetical protein
MSGIDDLKDTGISMGSVGKGTPYLDLGGEVSGVKEDGGRWRLRLQDCPPSAQGSAEYRLATEMVVVFENALNLAMEKNQGYGDAWQQQGWMGNLARILSKTARLKNLAWRDLSVEYATEPHEETVVDLINLAVFFLFNRRDSNKWGRGPRG